MDSADVVARARAAIDRAPEDPEVVSEAAAVLVAEAERHPLDEPERRRGPAEIAAEATRRCLASMDGPPPGDDRVAGRLLILRANALRLAGHSHDAEARQAFEEALRHQPDSAGWHYDLGLLHKHRGRWREALAANVRARELGGDTKPVLWNLAIAATALGEGETAAECWRSLGIDARVNDAGMPVVAGLDPVQVRVPSRGTGHRDASAVPDQAATFELLWAAPLSPVHGVVQSPAFREAPVDWGDVVLWDGAPVGVTEIEGTPVPRFILLEILRRGEERRLRFVGLQQGPGEVERLQASLPDGSLVFVQAERVEHVCPRCASGDVLVKHEHAPPEEHRIVHGKIIVPSGQALDAVRDALEHEMRSRGTFQIAVPELYEQLGDTRRAGQEHQAWRGIERVAIRRGIA